MIIIDFLQQLLKKIYLFFVTSKPSYSITSLLEITETPVNADKN